MQQALCVVLVANLPPDALARFAVCARFFRTLFGVEARKGRRRLLRQALHRSRATPTTRWVRCMLWDDWRRCVTKLSSELLCKSLKMTRRELTKMFCNQETFDMTIRRPTVEHGTPLQVSEMNRWIDWFDEVADRHLIHEHEVVGIVVRSRLAQALNCLPMFMLRLLVARDCHLGNCIDRRYSFPPLTAPSLDPHP